MALEPLLQHIRLNPNIKGLETGTYHHKIAAYADDLLFYISDPHTSLPNLLSAIDKYGELSDFKINLQKSEALNITLSPSSRASVSGNFPFRWSPQAIKYLGTKIPSDLHLIYHLNFQPLLNVFSTDLDRWRGLAISWFGRCNVLKMNIMPRLLYLLQALPVRIPQEFFRKLRSVFVRYVWQGKPPRLKRSLLQRPKLRGGVGLPDPALYYTAVHMNRIVDWCRHSSHKLWIGLEQETIQFPIEGLPWSGTHSSRFLPAHPLLDTTLEEHRRYSKLAETPNFPSPMTPIIGHPDFHPGLSDRSFRLHSDRSLVRASTFCGSTGWNDPSNTYPSFNNSVLGRWKILQLSHFLRSLPEAKGFCRQPTPFEELCMGEEPIRKSLSLSYNILLNHTSQQDPPYLGKWERDLNITFTEDQKIRILFFAHKSSLCSKYQEVTFKILTRWYRTPSVLASIFPGHSPLCWRCSTQTGTLIHVFWECPALDPFWRQVLEIIHRLTGVSLRNNPAAVLLNLTPMSSKRYRKSLLKHLLNAARACIPSMWKQQSIPTMTQWFSRVSDIQQMESLTAAIGDKEEEHSTRWTRWNMFRFSDEYNSYT